jgi:hypothetical protein
MKCPHCHHVSDTALLECSACGETYHRATLETFQHLEYLLAWLDEQAPTLGPQTRQRLRNQALTQLDAARDALGLPPPLPPRAPKEIARELAFVQATHEALNRWQEASALPPNSAHNLRQLFSRQIDDLETELAGRSVAIEPLRASDVLDFALQSLPAWAENAPLRPSAVASLRRHLKKERTEILQPIAHELALVKAMLKQVWTWARAARIYGPTLHRHLKAQARNLETTLAGHSLTVEAPSDLEVLDHALASLPSWAQELSLHPDEAASLRAHLNLKRDILLQPPPPTPAPAPAAPPVPEPTPVAPPSTPPAPEPPPPPIFAWSRWWDQAWRLIASDTLLRGLLYLGAFMVVVALAILALRDWSDFSPLVQLAFIAAVPLIFYLIGITLRIWFKTPEAGGVFIGIGALLVAVDLIVVYQFGGLAGRVDASAYWLGASLFCTLVYALTALRLPSEFFGYITLLGASSSILALTRVLRLPPEWDIAALAALAVAMTAGGARLERASHRWNELALAAWRLPQILIPASQVLALFVPGNAPLGRTGTFACAALGYGLLTQAPRNTARKTAILVHASVWSTVPAVGFVLYAAALPWEWYATVAAALAPLYTLAGQWIERQFHTDLDYRTATGWTGLGWVGLAILGGASAVVFDHLWAGVLALTLAALVLAWYAHFYRRPIFVFLAGALFIAPFSLSAHRWLGHPAQSEAWLMAAWAGLALAYLGLAALLRTAEKYVKWLNLWAHLLAPYASLVLLANYALTADEWFVGPTLAALGGVILVYLFSALIHDSERHPALSNWVNWLPEQIAPAVFLWPPGALLPLWLAVAWWGHDLDLPWLGPALAALALTYVGLGQGLARRKAAYRLPPHVYTYVLSVIAVLTALEAAWPLLTALCLVVGVLVALAVAYRRAWEVALAALTFIWPFQLALELSPLTPHTHALAYALLASLVYVPPGVTLARVDRKYARPGYAVGYAMSAYALVASLLGRFDAYPLDVPWVGVAVPLVVTGLQVFSAYHFKRSLFAWAAALVFPLAFGQALTLLHVPPEYDATAWVGLALAYLLTGRALARPRGEEAWFQVFRWPLEVGTESLCGLGLLLTVEGTALAFMGKQVENHLPLILAQALAVALTILAARLYRSRWPLYLEPWLALFPVTLFCVGYVTPSQFGVAWAVLGLAHLSIAVLLDRASERYAHGLHLGGYALNLLAILWTLTDLGALFWTLGLGLVAASGSALLVHLNQHRTWDELVTLLFAQAPDTTRTAIRGAFLWLAAWPFPPWCVLLLRQLDIVNRYQWLGLAAPPLLLLGLALRLRRVERTYAWPLHTAAQYHTGLGLLISTPLTARILDGYLAGRHHLPSDTPDAPAFILVQVLAVTLYAASAWAFKQRFFAHLAAWLSLLPCTLGWMVYGPALDSAQFSWVWIGWATVLLGVGYALDRKPVRYAHGPYLAGYLLGSLALLWSVQTLHACLYTLAATIALALISHLLVHYGRHRSFDDGINFIWRGQNTVAQRATRAVFFFFAVYAFPLWLTLLLTYHEVSLAWRGLALVLLAPLYVACGLAVRRANPTYAWPLYSAGYALSAIGALLTLGDEQMTIYALALDAVLYALSAYVFRQPFWLYLSNALVPVIALLTLHYNQTLSAPWVAGTFMGLAFLNFGAGQWFDWRHRKTQTRQGIAPFALPFYAPGYLLSVIALAVAGEEKILALAIYSAGVGLYALSAWAFRQALFLYPAAWLAAVPYYLGMTLMPLSPPYYGLGWLPLVVTYLALGRLAFHKTPLGIRDSQTFLAALPHPAMPFYLLAYALSVGMMALSWREPLILALAFAAGAAVYLASAALFRLPAWLYPGLIAAHLALAAYASTHFSESSAHHVALPFLGMTWIMALIGYGASGEREVKRGNGAFLHHLVASPWARPFFQLAAFDLVFWQTFALRGDDTATVLGLGHAVLLGLLTTLWRDTTLAYGALGYAFLALGCLLRWLALPLAEALAFISETGFGLYLLAWGLEELVTGVKQKTHPLAVWPRPLTYAAISLTTLATMASLGIVASRTIAVAAVLTFAGALYLTSAYRSRRLYLGYLGMAMLELAWVLALTARAVKQPQFYAIPAGLYFVGIGALERRRARRPFAIYVECFGLAVLLLTSLIQSLDSVKGLPYFALLLVEALLVVCWGAARRVKIPFFIGLGTSVLNVVAQVTTLLLAGHSDSSGQGDPLLTAVLIILGVGLLAMLVAVLVERQRARIIAQAQEWREALDAWD